MTTTVAPAETRSDQNQVLNVASSSASVGTYYAIHRFAPNSKLHRYLALKASTYVSLGKTDYTLYEILLAMKKVISENKLYDPQNPTVILCDENLEDVLDVKALHVSEIREQICKQFPRLSPPEAVAKRNEEQTSGQLGGQIAFQAPAQGQNQLNVSIPNVPATLTPGQTQGQSEPSLSISHTAPVTATIPQPQAPAVDNFTLPAWASNTANAVTARMLFNSTPQFDIEASYWVKPNFLKVLRSVEGVNQTQLVFPYREITSILSKYIMKNKNRFFDLRNIRVALVENDPLGKAFGVKAFARSQVTSLIRAQLKLFVPPAEAAKCDDDDDSKKDDSSITKRKRSSDEESLEGDKSLPTASNSQDDMLAKRQRRRSCNVSVTILGYSSGEETIYSAQGYETSAICDETCSTDSETSQDDEEYSEENIYRVEYEVDNGSDDCDDDAERRKERAEGSEEDSDVEDVMIASAVLVNEMEASDFANWADSDSEVSDSSDSDFALSNYDPELQHGSDVWNCVTCGQPNTPFMRYCHRCWEERKGWVPERSKPRRRKKNKKTNGIAVKKSATLGIQKRTSNLGATSSGRSGNYHQSNRHCLERSFSDPSGSVQIMAQITKNGHSNMEIKSLVFEGEKEINLIATISNSKESLRSGSQGSDSGFSQESQEILSQETDSDKEDAVVALKDVVAESTDSGHDEVVEKDLASRKRQKMSLDFGAGKRRWTSGADAPVLSIRKQELPLNLQNKTRNSVLLTPDTDSTCSDHTILTRNPTLSTSNPSLLCTMCCVRTKDACFIHGQISHQVCCYPCAKMIFKNRGTCPVCRRKIEKITRNIIV